MFRMDADDDNGRVEDDGDNAIGVGGFIIHGGGTIQVMSSGP